MFWVHEALAHPGLSAALSVRAPVENMSCVGHNNGSLSCIVYQPLMVRTGGSI